jgi:hypothetical protein
VFGDGMTVETDAAATLAAAPLVFGDGMTVETDAAASLAAAPLVFGDGMTAVETDAAASVLTGVVWLFPGATLLRVNLAAAVRGDSSGYGCGLAWFRRVFTFPCAAPCALPLSNLVLWRPVDDDMMHRNDINTQILTSLPSAARQQRLVTVAEYSNVTLYGTTKLCSLIQVSMHATTPSSY